MHSRILCNLPVKKIYFWLISIRGWKLLCDFKPKVTEYIKTLSMRHHFTLNFIYLHYLFTMKFFLPGKEPGKLWQHITNATWQPFLGLNDSWVRVVSLLIKYWILKKPFRKICMDDKSMIFTLMWEIAASLSAMWIKLSGLNKIKSS